MVDNIIIVLFFVISFALGAFASKGVKSFTHYSVGHRSFSSFVIFATLSASFIGGGYTLGNAAKVYELGLIYTFALFGFSLKEILVGMFLAPRMSIHRDCLSVGDIIEKHYGRQAKIITGMLSVFLCMGILGAQVGAMAYIFSTFFNIDSLWAVWTAFIIVIAYSAIGGMRAVVFTDVFQFVILLVGIPLTFFIGLYSVGGGEAVFNKVPHDFIYFLDTGHNATLLLTLFITFIFGETLVPPYVQRLFMGRNEKHTKHAIIASGIVSIPFFMVAGCIGLVALTMNPNINANEALPYVVKQVLPVGIKGFVIAALLSIIISSASSFLNAASISLVNDICKPLSKVHVSDTAWLRLAKISTLAIGMGSVFFALAIHNVLDILLYAYNSWSPIILIPLVMALLGVRVGKRDFYSSAIGGVIGMLIWTTYLENPWGISGVVAGLSVSLLFFGAGRLILPAPVRE